VASQGKKRQSGEFRLSDSRTRKAVHGFRPFDRADAADSSTHDLLHRSVEHNADYNCGPNYPGLPGGDSAAGPSGDNVFACTIRGTDGNDVLNGTPGPDVICGFGGNDTINGGGGNDIIYGGLGNDTITGGSGSDSLHGNGGNDRIFGRDGQLDLIAGDAGRDTATVDKGLDTVRGVEIITR
jgi:hypothetical protein